MTMITSSEFAFSEGSTMKLASYVAIDNSSPHEAHPGYWAPFVVVGEGAAGR
jgi:hypothetical protein